MVIIVRTRYHIQITIGIILRNEVCAIIALIASQHLCNLITAIYDRQRGSQRQCRVEHTIGTCVGLDTGLFALRIRKVGSDFQFVEPVALFRIVKQRIFRVAAHGETTIVRLRVVTTHDTILTIVTQREVVVEFLGSARNAHLMVCHRCIVVEHGFLPVGAVALHGLQLLCGITGLLSAVDIAFVHHHTILIGVEHIAGLPLILPTERGIVVDLRLTHLTALGVHQNHTVSSTSTIDGTRSSILEHLDALDIIRVKVLDTRLTGHTVNDVKRVGIVDGTNTTHANL